VRVVGVQEALAHEGLGYRDAGAGQDHVDVLVRLLVHPLEPALPSQRDERGPVQERIGHARHEVRRAEAEGAEAHAGPTGQPTLDVGHEGAGLLVADRHELDRRALQRVGHIERLLAGDPEDPPDALGLEAPHEQVRGPFGRSSGGRCGLVGLPWHVSSVPDALGGPPDVNNRPQNSSPETAMSERNGWSRSTLSATVGRRPDPGK
jgi:hypothetical protein